MAANKKRTYEFLQLTNTISYPPAYKAKLSIAHSNFIEQALACFDGTRKTKEHVIHIFNCISYMYVCGDTLPTTWDINDPMHTYTDTSDDELETKLVGLFLHPKDVDWIDVPITSSHITSSEKVVESVKPIKVSVRKVPKSNPVQLSDAMLGVNAVPATAKSDLYIQPPVVPRFNVSESLASGNIDGTLFVVYKSLPEIPTKQNEISATTDINKMTESDLLKLFPTDTVRTRAECMYQICENIELDPILGLILPVHGYTRKQLRDNIIKYPHIFKLLKQVNGLVESFYSTIEIDGELHKVSDIWAELPESTVIPYTKEFVKEYVVRRYLLERDVKGIQHRYTLYGTLDPFLTLFTTPREYDLLGYKDPVQLAHSCVYARVNYKRSRNPVLRRLSNV